MANQQTTGNKRDYRVNRDFWIYKTNPIIRGYFPKHKSSKELAISRVNKFLIGLIVVSALLIAVSYYFVITSEAKLNSLRKETIALTDENVELQNQLDYLRSYSNVAAKMKQSNMLQKAENTIEVNESQVPFVAKDIKFDKHNFVWSLGY